jgi:hypothetical protein
VTPTARCLRPALSSSPRKRRLKDASGALGRPGASRGVHLKFQLVRKAIINPGSRLERERPVAYQRAVEDAFHPRNHEILSVRAPRYATYVERDRDKVKIHLLREWGQSMRRVDSIEVRSFPGTEVEAAAICLEEFREKGRAREEADLDEWLRQREAEAEKQKKAAEALRPARQRQEAQADREAERLRRQADAEAEQRVAAIEAEGLAEALRTPRRRRWR